jgi:hypothetical protein
LIGIRQFDSLTTRRFAPADSGPHNSSPIDLLTLAGLSTDKHLELVLEFE